MDDQTGYDKAASHVAHTDELNSLPERLDFSWIPKVPGHTTGSPQQNDFNQEEDVNDPQLLKQEGNAILVQVKPVCCQIKEEQEELRISQEGEQFGLKQETETFNEDLPQKHECKQEEVLDDQQLWNQERNNGPDLEEPKPLQVKEEHEGSINQGEVLLVQKQEADTFMLTSIYEQNDHREAETSKFETTINLQYRLPDVSKKPVIKLNRTDPDLTQVLQLSEVEPPSPASTVSSSPSPATTVSSSPSPAPTMPSSASGASGRTRLGKRRRDTSMALLHYLERSDNIQQEQNRRDEEMTSRVLQSLEQTRATAATLVGLLERAVSVLEQQNATCSNCNCARGT
ncbi:uncharacterized protein KZ484_021706 [Pholidichthys leucotaenia]